MADKKCIKCGETKPLDQFKKHSECKDGRCGTCYSCGKSEQRTYRKLNGNKATRVYEKTKSGFLMRTYRNMKSRVAGIIRSRNCKGMALCDGHEFYRWSLSDPAFLSLFSAWEAADYNQSLSPSVDRVDPERGYTFDNIRWITHGENSARATRGKRLVRISRQDFDEVSALIEDFMRRKYG